MPEPPTPAPTHAPDTGPSLHGYVGLGPGADSDPSLYYGRIYWFSIRETSVQADAFTAAAKAILPSTLQPNPIRTPDAFSRAIASIASWKPKPEENPDLDGIRFVRAQQKDDSRTHFLTAVIPKAHGAPSYVTLAMARLVDKTPDAKERLWDAEITHIEPDHQGLYDAVAERFANEFGFFKTHYTDEHIRGLLGRAIDKWDAFLARPTGGVYIVLEKHAADLARLQTFVRQYAGEMWAIPLARTAESKDLILTTYEQQTVGDIEAFLPQLDDLVKAGSVDESDYKGVLRRVQRWRSSKEKYEAELQTTMEKVDLQLQIAVDRIAKLAPLVKAKEQKAL